MPTRGASTNERKAIMLRKLRRVQGNCPIFAFSEVRKRLFDRSGRRKRPRRTHIRPNFFLNPASTLAAFPHIGPLTIRKLPAVSIVAGWRAIRFRLLCSVRHGMTAWRFGAVAFE